ncbi:MAG: lipid-A-disaccharide synthase [Gammaproteobacteria bacterium]|nr:lipid-A-disaccharide synthase [Rhodocyclaceae bacterium]MBU3908971.1 lipid-A-disaccharide synthase [Gammaproteobacteria bacterium]MBU3988225.1 lipid-A-disaccharide synthase [Gammaproteobacteria bacterium]MBU4005842.1 lipid-A-disaccharide synthase [Gammaproteobacteria bacterium]MBU4021606.1 lipid-A-disaccharide synthase [Gammaproteobacteria bacterium]
MSPLRIALVAGEASGDLLAAHLIDALKRRLPNAEFCGIGGPKMQRAGFNAWWPAETLAVRGYAEVLRHYRKITSVRRALLKRLLAEKPDVFIGVDAPDFNLWLEKRLKRAGIPTVHYVSPSVWAWRGGRVRRIAQSVNHLLALFPFEPPLYEKTDLSVTYVGHPLADVLPLEVSRSEARERLGLPSSATPVFALLPGSRQSEVRFMAALFIKTAGMLRARFPDALFLVPLVSRETRNNFENEIWAQGAQELPIKLLFGHAQDAFAACDAALVASGTATLEAALLKTPMVITYRMSPWSWWLMKRMHYQPWVGLPNILAGSFVVPEFLQDDATPENLAQALGNLVVDTEVRKRLTHLFTDMHRQLRQNTAEKAAGAILSLLPQ